MESSLPAVQPSFVDTVVVQPAKVIRQHAAVQNGHAKAVLPFSSQTGEETGRQDSRATADAADTLSTVMGVIPLRPQGKAKVFTWVMEKGAAANYRSLGKLLAASGDLFRHQDGHALVQVLPNCKTRLISKGSQLAPVIVDRLKMIVTKGGKVTSELPAANHLNAMLRSEKFLRRFRSVDEVTTHPLYRDDFTLARPGYNDGGPGQRILYLGHEPEIAGSTATIDRFLAEMKFASNADLTNTVAAALTVLLRRKWPGQKPVVLVTSTKSHSGKGTITDFFRGSVPKADVLYEALDWPMQSQFQRQVQANPEVGVVVFDNVRSDSSGRASFIRSGFIESFVTSADVTLASPGAGGRREIPVVFVIVACLPNALKAIERVVRQFIYRELAAAGIENDILEFAPTIQVGQRVHRFVDCNENSPTKGMKKVGLLYRFAFQIKPPFMGFFYWGGFCNRVGQIPERSLPSC
jgi:hypothetical protein